MKDASFIFLVFAIAYTLLGIDYLVVYSFKGKKSMRVGIVGSRTFNDYSKMKEEFLNLYSVEDIECIFSGGAIGADSLARKLAEDLGIEIVEILPDWNKYGKSAGYIRNQVIVASSDEILAFWDGRSRGTNHTLDLAGKKAMPVHIVSFR